MSGAPVRVFVARLAGMAVFDPNGDQVGRVRDAVVTLRIGRAAPRVHGLVVEVPGRRRIFLPLTRVLSIDVGRVITTGLVNMRRFEQRPAERLVIAELLDRTVTRLTDDEPVVVIDLAMEQQRAKDWLLTRVAVREQKNSNPLRRRSGATETLEWDEISGLALSQEGQGAANLLAAFEKLRPADLAAVMHELSPKRRGELAAALPDEQLADVLEELPEDDQVEILSKLAEERAADVLEAMDPDDAADLLSELPAEDAEKLLELMDPDEARDVRRLLTYEEYTAGGMMTTDPVILPPDATVAEALAHVRSADLAPALAAAVYVCRSPQETPTGKYLGMAHIQRLLREPPHSLVAGVLDTDTEPARPHTTLAVLTRYLATYNLVALPVVDENNRLVGAVTVDDVLDHLLPDDWREQPHEPETGRAVTDAAR